MMLDSISNQYLFLLSFFTSARIIAQTSFNHDLEFKLSRKAFYHSYRNCMGDETLEKRIASIAACSSSDDIDAISDAADKHVCCGCSGRRLQY